MMNRRGALKVGGLTAAGTVLAGCGGGGSSSGGKSGGGNELRLSQATDATTLDPQKQGDLPSMNILINIFDTLTVRNADNKLVAGIATSWKAIKPTTWRFQLRKGVTFHNGEVCDAAAVAFSINRLINPATQSPIVELSSVTTAKVVDPQTVDIITSKPDPILPEKVSLFGGVVLPPKYLKQKGDAGFAAHPVGTGPFSFESRQQDSQVVLKANPKYWGGKPPADKLTIRIMPDPSSSLAALQSGELDLVTNLTPDAGQQLGNSGDLKVVQSPGIRTYFISLDTSGGPLAKKAVRQALNYAVDVPTLIKSVLDGAAQQTPTLIPHQSFGFDKSVPAFRHDKAKATSLLKQAGYASGFATTLTASTVDKDMATAVVGQLAEVGIKAKLTILDPASFKQRLVSSNKKALGDMYLTGNTGWTLDAESNLQSFIRHDRRQSRWNDPAADKLIDAEESSVKPAERQSAFNTLQQMLAQDAPFVYLYQASNVYALTSRLQWKMNANGTLAMGSAKLQKS
jgi:peptide/nickel transport system substrate-binding protein